MIHFSVVIPCFNAQETIVKTLRSVLSQTEKSMEVIVIDDGSTDETVSRVQSLREEFSEEKIPLQVLTQENAGVSATRNRGVSLAVGQYIAFLDADDRWVNNKLQRHFFVMQSDPNIAISFARCRVLDSQGRATRQLSSLPLGRQTMACVFAENPTTTTSNLVVRRDVFQQLDGFDESMSFAEDQEFIMRVLSHSRYHAGGDDDEQFWSVQGVDAVLTEYFTNEHGLSSELQKMYDGWLKMVEVIRSYAPQFVEQNFRPAQARYCRYLARRSLRVRSTPSQGWYFTRQALLADWRCLFRKPVHTAAIFSLSALRAVSHGVQNFASKTASLFMSLIKVKPWLKVPVPKDIAAYSAARNKRSYSVSYSRFSSLQQNDQQALESAHSTVELTTIIKNEEVHHAKP